MTELGRSQWLISDYPFRRGGQRGLPHEGGDFFLFELGRLPDEPNLGTADTDLNGLRGGHGINLWWLTILVNPSIC